MKNTSKSKPVEKRKRVICENLNDTEAKTNTGVRNKTPRLANGQFKSLSCVPSNLTINSTYSSISIPKETNVSRESIFSGKALAQFTDLNSSNESNSQLNCFECPSADKLANDIYNECILPHLCGGSQSNLEREARKHLYLKHFHPKVESFFSVALCDKNACKYLTLDSIIVEVFHLLGFR